MSNQVTLEAIKSYFEAAELPYLEDEECGIIHSGFKGLYGTYQFVVDLSDDHDVLLFMVPGYLMASANGAAPELRKALLQVNYDLLMGNFEENLEDGEVRFRLAVPLAGNDFTKEQFDHCLIAMAVTIDKYFPVFSRIIWGDMPAAEALEMEQMKMLTALKALEVLEV